MAPLADLLLAYIPFRLPHHLSSYVIGKTPLSTTPVVVSMLAGYLTVIFGIKALMTNRQPYKLTTLFQIHNIFLSSGSALLLALMLEEIVPHVWRHGIRHALCDEAAWTSRMEFYYMINYYFKYLELLDTVFLALKKKPMQFLHVFHHSATALLCFTQLNGKTSISWSVITLNLAVHVVMCKWQLSPLETLFDLDEDYYYYATAGGARFWWKKYLTTMQIVQFVVDISLVYYGTYEHFTHAYYPYLPHSGNCAGAEGSALFGCALLTSYLGLFINFYFQTYKKPASSRKPKSVANGHANGFANGKANGTAGEQLNERDSEQEYFTCAEIYISNAAAATLRKASSQIWDSCLLKKQNESDSRPKGSHLETLSYNELDDPDTNREIQLAWSRWKRPYSIWALAESTLFKTVYIHLLRQTDIRPADNSLFFRKDCIAIFSTEQQRWIANNNAEPIYLQFPKSDLCSLWIWLLRSYAVPEIYGRWLKLKRPTTEEIGQEGGSYRMWREVQLTVASGRNLGTSKFYDPSQDPDDIGQEGESKDIDVYCEIVFNDAVCARTTIKKGLGLPEWHEFFVFSHLPPFESFEIMIWKEKKIGKPSLLGKVTVDLITFRRGEVVEGWYPVQSTSFSSQLQLGELRLKLQVLDTRNSLRWMQDLENTLHIKTLPPSLTKLAISQETIVQQIQEAARWEVEKAIPSHQTIFRGNTVFTKTMESCFSRYGNAFLEVSIGSPIRKLLAEKVAIEVDPGRRGKPSKDVVKNVDLLISWCREFWDHIFAAKDSCPEELCATLCTIRDLVEEHSRKADLAPEMQQQRPWQSVSAFIFLRFLVPGILHPHLFGLCSGLPDPAIQRSLKLIAKVIQSLANLNTSDQKEMAMIPLREFNKQNIPRMMEYLKAVSTTKSGLYSNPKLDSHEGRHVSTILARHKEILPVLERESVPEPPHYIDLSRELAIITSAVARHSRDMNNKTGARKFDDVALDSLCAACFEVEAEALQRVKELATRLAKERRQASASAAWSKHPTSLPKSPSLGSVQHSGYAPPGILEPRSQLTSKSLQESGPSPLPQAPSHVFEEKPDVIKSDTGENDKVKWSQAETLPEVSDDVAKRKRSFMRGIFGGL
ncbi:hypothetical protein D9756_003766 [Leucocoprinus leucothites]|uniref:Very-long-chain 3-oxoacyl-CoA synthase n=1 Tax=Leucocoprinus leucothites TaxID=201217 RepID=A0A8H5DAG7_9AGAR|nr:hypothetical protein D9756_003766 [Leucoagaricus leucothites]